VDEAEATCKLAHWADSANWNSGNLDGGNFGAAGYGGGWGIGGGLQSGTGGISVDVGGDRAAAHLAHD
jgi:hypothetical protein